MSIPILPLAEWPEGINQASLPANDNANRLEILSGLVISKAVTAQPAGVEGAIYILPGTHTGAQWAGFSADDLVIYKGGTWHAFAPIDGIVVNFAGHQEQFSGSSGWGTVDGGGAVSSVNTQTGVVVLDSDDIAEGSANLYATNERIDDRVAALLVAGTDITLTYNDGANTLTVAASGGGGGTVTSVDASGGVETVAGSPITTTGTIRVSRLVNAQTGTSYTYLTGDRGKLVTHSNAGAIAGTLPQATGTFPAGWSMIVKNKGAGTLTITPTTSTIDGAATLVLTTGQWADITSDGANYQAVVYAPSAGGGSLTGFTSALNTASPNNVINASSLTPSGGTTNQDGVYGAKGSGAIQAHIADGTSAGGNKRGQYSVDWQQSRSAATAVASANYAFIGAGVNNSVTGLYGSVVGGNANTASGQSASVTGGASNTASQPSACVAGGTSNTASGTGAFVGGGASNTASGTYSAAFGQSNVASGDNSTVLGRSGTSRGLVGAVVSASGNFAIGGDAQKSQFVMRVATSNATQIAVTGDGNAATASNSVALPNSYCYAFEAMVSARSQATGDSATFRIVGAIKRGTSAGTTALLGTPTVTVLGADAGASAWTVAAVANTTLGSLEIQVTGAASTNIRWMGSVSTYEVGG